MRLFVIRSLESAIRRGGASASSCRRFSSDSGPERKVAILGAAGGIGQPLALLMKLNPLVSTLALYDIAGTPGVAADVSHINTRAEVAGYAGEEQLGKALEGSDVVVIPAGVPRKPGMTRDDLFNINAGIVKSLCTAISKYCPNVYWLSECYVGHICIVSVDKVRSRGAIFADACLKGLNGVPDVVECSFVQSSITELPFFASKVRLGKNGVEEVLGLGSLSDYEEEGLEKLKPELKASIEKGIKFARET
ncbi:hypothetical protein B296_00028164 [Ensete ventricosum]|uniref:malate dehydrogenase n=1 Tax=Ensete ventricosum TaxID=4639 RepID=A0A426YWZ2_ENSVE|nr:hypothetical protein B296_00028164 [Ensete ventricosum]